MKKLIVTCMVLLMCGYLGSQTANNNKFYLSTGSSFGNYVGGDFNLNFIFGKSSSFQIGYAGNIRKAKSTPSNYEPSKLNKLLALGGPYDYFGSVQIQAGKTFWLNETNTTRLNLLGGLGFTQISEPTNWIFSTYEFTEYSSASITFTPKFEFVSKKNIGASISLMVQATPKRTVFGIGFDWMIGNLR